MKINLGAPTSYSMLDSGGWRILSSVVSFSTSVATLQATSCMWRSLVVVNCLL